MEREASAFRRRYFYPRPVWICGVGGDPATRHSGEGDHMSRTMRDIPVPGGSQQEIWNQIRMWMNANSGWVVGGSVDDSSGTYVKVRMGAGAMQASRFFEISIRPDSNGVSVHTEGYTKAWGQEQDLSPSAISGALPRRQGWRAIEDLWNRIASSSRAPPGARPSPRVAVGETDRNPPEQRHPVEDAEVGPSLAIMIRCQNCGALAPETAKFCGKCGKSLQ